MKATKALLSYACCLLALSVLSAPPFVTGRMIDRRNGLTDEQYDYLWSIGRSPEIGRNVARDWMFRASRYQNVTNWLDICGKTNNFAALSYDLQGRNFVLDETNRVLTATNRVLASTCVRLADEVSATWSAYTNQLAQTEAFSNLYVRISATASAATAKIADEIADLEAKIVKYQEYQKKYPIAKSIFAAMITDAENRIAILQALTGETR